MLGFTLSCDRGALRAPDLTSTPLATPVIVKAVSSPSPTIVARPSAKVLREQVAQIITVARKEFPGRSAVVFVDLDQEIRLEFAAKNLFESASLAKLMVLVELYREFQLGVHRPDETVVLLAKQKVGGSGHLKQAAEGSKHRLDFLAEHMIVDSDNTATQMLTDLLGRKKIAQSMQAIGLAQSTFGRDIYDFEAIDEGRDNLTSPLDIATLLVQIARQDLPGAERMHEILEGQKRKDLFGKGFPPQVRLAHKTGELQGVLHDAGIVYSPRGAFVLVALGDEIRDMSRAKECWAHLARDILQVYLGPKDG